MEEDEGGGHHAGQANDGAECHQAGEAVTNQQALEETAVADGGGPGEKDEQ